MQFLKLWGRLALMTVSLASKSVRDQAEMDAGGLSMELMERMVLLPVCRTGER